MRVALFLDFDGVLHPAAVYDPAGFFRLPPAMFVNMPQLVEVLDACPQIDIVVSAGWRSGTTLRQLRAYFPEPIQRRIVGRTPIFPATEALDAKGVRQAEVEAWVRRRGGAYSTWLAIDDHAWRYREGETRLVVTDSMSGLTPDVAVQLVARVADLVAADKG